VFVRRPVDLKPASGVVAVEPLHSSGIWGMQTLLQPYFVAHNDVHVGVAASNDVVERLVKGANPTRYASLTVPATADAPNQVLAGVTRTFISSPQALATIDGRRVFDGFFPGKAAVGSSGGAQVGPIPDVGVPVVELQGERELLVTVSI
jgi:hypothetical protein